MTVTLAGLEPATTAKHDGALYPLSYRAGQEWMGGRGSNPYFPDEGSGVLPLHHPPLCQRFADGSTSRVPGRRFGLPVPGTAESVRPWTGPSPLRRSFRRAISRDCSLPGGTRS